MTTIVKAATASDFLALVPRLVGFHPHESLVFVAFRGNRTCGAMRFDLPAPDPAASDAAAPASATTRSSRVDERIATTLVGMLSKLSGVDAVVPVVYTGATFAAGPGIPRSAFIGSVVARLRFSGFTVRDALCVAADGWGSYLDPDCPARGRPLADVESSRILDGVPPADLGPVGSVADRAALPEADPHERRSVVAALERFTAVLDARAPWRSARKATRGPEVDSDPGLPSLDDIPATLEEIVSHPSAAVDPLGAAFVIAISRAPAIRDVVMMQWAFDRAVGARVLADAADYSRGVPAGALETAGLMLGRGPRPDQERVDGAIAVLKSITAMAPDADRAPLYCMLAWLNWALGRSSVADVFVTEALRVDTGYGLADLLRAVLDRAILPEWAFGDVGPDCAGTADPGSNPFSR